MQNNEDDYNDILLDKIMQWRSLPNYADSAIKYLCEAELNPGQEDLFLKKAQVMAMLEMSRLLNQMNQRP
jgi:hypothetical protein